MDSGTGVVVGTDGVARCPWGAGDPVNLAYHDTEWGLRVSGEAAHLERLTLEAFQSGLSWRTILNKRPHFRTAFAGFDADTIAAFGPDDVERLMADTGIVRNRMKVDATLHNARVAAGLPDGLTALLWSYASAPRPRPASRADVPAITPESTALAKALKKLGFKFVGPTTAYALMQATGMVDDHLAGCFVAPESR